MVVTNFVYEVKLYNISNFALCTYIVVFHFHQILSCVQTQSHMSSHGFLCPHLDRLNLPLDTLLLDHFIQNSPSCSRILRKKFFLSETYIQQLYNIVLKCAIPCSVQFKKKVKFSSIHTSRSSQC